MARRVVAILLAAAAMTAPAVAEPVLLHAAGSLRTALTEVAGAFEAASGSKVQAKALPARSWTRSRAGRAPRSSPPPIWSIRRRWRRRARAARPCCSRATGSAPWYGRGSRVQTATLLERMLDAGVKLATSTPRADPSGDYAWEVFRKADRLKPGAFVALEKKALQLTGGPNSPTVAPGRTIYGALVAAGKADIFLTYCTGALEAQKQNPGQQVVALPDELTVGADYGLTVLGNASPQAYAFAMFILSTEGQRVLAKHGFAAPALPQ